MEIRDPVHGTIFLSDQETQVIDTPEFQRLRAIKQLGFAEFSFPGATHNRYLHSIGVCHLAGQAFDHIFKNYPFSSKIKKDAYRKIVRLGALLHDVGHGPLSHTTEEVMPLLSDLKIDAYKYRRHQVQQMGLNEPVGVRANHEDYTIKFITDSELTKQISTSYSEFSPLHLASLIDKTLHYDENFFIDEGVNFLPLFSQIVSSELDADRMDYLERDSYFCGTNYGKVDLFWLISNFTFHIQNDRAFLGLNRRALYTFDDFLISRHHMHLMVYFHHKSIIYEEMLNNYLTSSDCKFFLPANIEEYTLFNDYKLFEHLAESKNAWARRIARRAPYRVLIELHHLKENPRAPRIVDEMEKNNISTIHASSKMRLSKYHSSLETENSAPIFVVDQYDKWDKPAPINEVTEIFQKYEGARVIDRIYVAPEDHKKAEEILKSKKI